MSVRFVDHISGWLVAVAAAGTLPIAAQAQTGAPTTARALYALPQQTSPTPGAGRNIQQTARRTPSPVAAPKSDVQKQLEMLYARDGRPMPEMAPTASPSRQPVAGQPAPQLRTQMAAPQAMPQQQYAAPVLQQNAAYPAPQSASQPAQQAAYQAPAQPPASGSKNPLSTLWKNLRGGTKTSTAPTQLPAAPPSLTQLNRATGPQPPSVPPEVFSRDVYSPEVYSPPTMGQNVDSPPPMPTVPVVASTSELPDLYQLPTVTSDFNSAAPQTQIDVLRDQFDAPGNATAMQPLAVGDDFADPFTDVSERDADLQQPANPYAGQPLIVPQDDGPAMMDDEEDDLDELEDEREPLTIREGGSQPQLLPADRSSTPRLSSHPLATNEHPVADKMRKIQERSGSRGFKGFCPVTLRDERELVDASPQITASYRGQRYQFANEHAKTRFEANSIKYAPAAYGADVVTLVRDQDVLEGTLDYAAWYQGRLYLFASQETHDLFVATPETYATPAGLE